MTMQNQVTLINICSKLRKFAQKHLFLMCWLISSFELMLTNDNKQYAANPVGSN